MGISKRRIGESMKTKIVEQVRKKKIGETRFSQTLIFGYHGRFVNKPYVRDPKVYLVILAIISVSMTIGIAIGKLL